MVIVRGEVRDNHAKRFANRVKERSDLGPTYSWSLAPNSLSAAAMITVIATRAVAAPRRRSAVLNSLG